MCCLILNGFVSGKIVGPLCHFFFCVLCMVSSREGCLLEAFCTESKVRCSVEECAQAAERLVLDNMEAKTRWFKFTPIIANLWANTISISRRTMAYLTLSSSSVPSCCLLSCSDHLNGEMQKCCRALVLVSIRFWQCHLDGFLLIGQALYLAVVVKVRGRPRTDYGGYRWC